MQSKPSRNSTMASLPLSIILIFSLVSFSFSLSTNTLTNAITILSNSGHLSMSLTLQVYPTFSSASSSSLTIFAPSDSAFFISGQPSLSLLKLHLSTLSLSLNSLKTLPSGSRIPSLHHNKSLILTNDNGVALNGVKINNKPIFDDGSLIIFGIDNFFDPNFTALATTPSSSKNPACMAPQNGSLFTEACRVMKSEGYAIMAAFLGVQLRLHDPESVKITVFAAKDETLKSFGNVGNFSDGFDNFTSMFPRHVVPCRVTWGDLEGYDNGTVLWSYMDGFGMNVTKVGDVVMVNDAVVEFPGMYMDDWVVIHGLNKMLELPQKHKQEGKSQSEIGLDEVENVED